MYDKIFNIGYMYLDPPNHQHIIHSAGESHINLLCQIDRSDRVLIKARLNSAQSVMEMIMLADAISRKTRLIDAFFPYMPYSRADRVVGNGGGDAFGIQQFSSMIRNFFQKITTIDVHSNEALRQLGDHTGAAIKNLIPYDLFLRKLVDYYKLKEVCLVSPDSGALNKVASLANRMGLPIFTAEKRRDQTDKGKIISYTATTPFPENIKNAIILDDICDGGSTFLQVASLIPSSVKVYLGISHGIFSKGLPILWNGGFQGVITTDSFPQHKHNYNDLIVLGVDTCQ